MNKSTKDNNKEKLAEELRKNLLRRKVNSPKKQTEKNTNEGRGQT